MRIVYKSLRPGRVLFLPDTASRDIIREYKRIGIGQITHKDVRDINGDGQKSEAHLQRRKQDYRAHGQGFENGR